MVWGMLLKTLIGANLFVTLRLCNVAIDRGYTFQTQIGDVFNQLRLARQRVCYQPLDKGISCELDEGEALSETLAQLLAVLEALDARIGTHIPI